MASLDWGNVPQWVSGVLAALSTTLALLIILRDKRKAEQSEANRLGVVRSDYVTNEPNEGHFKLFLQNNSDFPIYNIVINELIEIPKRLVEYNYESFVFDRRKLRQRYPKLRGRDSYLGDIIMDFNSYVPSLGGEFIFAMMRYDALGRLLRRRATTGIKGMILQKLESRERQEFDFTYTYMSEFTVIMLRFTDGNNVRWEKNLTTRSLRRYGSLTWDEVLFYVPALISRTLLTLVFRVWKRFKKKFNL